MVSFLYWLFHTHAYLQYFYSHTFGLFGSFMCLWLLSWVTYIPPNPSRTIVLSMCTLSLTITPHENFSMVSPAFNVETTSWTGQYARLWWPYADANNKTGELSSCNQLQGTDGMQFPPFINNQEQEKLWVFSLSHCRTMDMKYDSVVNIGGINSSLKITLTFFT